MKKILTMLCSALLIGSIGITNVSASENVDYEKKIEIFDEMNAKLVITQIDNNLALYEVFDLESEELLLSAEIVTTKVSPVELLKSNINSYALIDNYDVFQNEWAFISKKQMSFNWIETTTLDATVLVVSTFLGGYGGTFVSIVYLIASKAYDYKYSGLSAKFYIKQNLYCSILRHEKLELYSDTNYTNKVHEEVNTGVWTSTPWDYGTVETACRILTERY